jgi:drug/metabolite transporter (DMT)-like permease
MWLLVVISAYFLFSISSLGDKYILKNRIPDPKLYAFYIGLLGTVALVFIPFGFSFPSFSKIIICLLSGFLFIIANFLYYKALTKFEASRVVPAIGGILPLFSLLIIYIFFPGEEKLSLLHFLAFLILILGSVIITVDQQSFRDRSSLKLAALAAFIFAISLVLSKYAFNIFNSFFAPFIWMRMGGFIAALVFLLNADVRKELSQRQPLFYRSTAIIFLGNASIGAAAFLLQNWAVSLASTIFLPIINAMQGIEYAFLLVFTVILSLINPKIISEKISERILIQKAIAVFLIGFGLFLLTK